MGIHHRHLWIDAGTTRTDLVGSTVLGGDAHLGLGRQDLAGSHSLQYGSGYLHPFLGPADGQTVIPAVKELSVGVHVPASGGLAEAGVQ